MTDEDIRNMLEFADEGGDGSVRMAEFVNIFAGIRCAMRPEKKMTFWGRLFRRPERISDDDYSDEGACARVAAV